MSFRGSKTFEDRADQGWCGVRVYRICGVIELNTHKTYFKDITNTTRILIKCNWNGRIRLNHCSYVIYNYIKCGITCNLRL